MGLLKGQNDTINDGDCLQILDTIFAKQLSECITYVEDKYTRSIDEYYHGNHYKTIMYYINCSIVHATYESTKAKLYDFVNHYELSYEDMNKLYRKYFVTYDPYTMKLNDSKIVTVDYENTVDYLSKQYKITDVLGPLPLTLTEYQNWAYLVNAFRSYDIVFNQEFIHMQTEFLTNSLKKFYGIN